MSNGMVKGQGVRPAQTHTKEDVDDALSARYQRASLTGDTGRPALVDGACTMEDMPHAALVVLVLTFSHSLRLSVAHSLIHVVNERRVWPRTRWDAGGTETSFVGC